jgi:hypothetical protein
MEGFGKKGRNKWKKYMTLRGEDIVVSFFFIIKSPHHLRELKYCI